MLILAFILLIILAIEVTANPSPCDAKCSATGTLAHTSFPLIVNSSIFFF